MGRLQAHHATADDRHLPAGELDLAQQGILHGVDMGTIQSGNLWHDLHAAIGYNHGIGFQGFHSRHIRSDVHPNIYAQLLHLRFQGLDEFRHHGLVGRDRSQIGHAAQVTFLFQ